MRLEYAVNRYLSTVQCSVITNKNEVYVKRSKRKVRNLIFLKWR